MGEWSKRLRPPSLPDGLVNSFRAWRASCAKASGRLDPGKEKPRRANHTGSARRMAYSQFPARADSAMRSTKKAPRRR